MEQLDQWWSQSPFERRPELPEREPTEHVPVDLQFQRVAHDVNLGKQTSDLMRLSPIYFQRFGVTDMSLKRHLLDTLEGMWEYLLSGAEPYTPPRRMGDIWAVMQGVLGAGEVLACESI